MRFKEENYEELLSHVNTLSRPSDLKITDIRFANLGPAHIHACCLKFTLIRV